MSKYIRALGFESENVGKIIKSTKKVYRWKFELDSENYLLVLNVHYLSGNVKLKLNNEVKFKGKKRGEIFNIPLKITRHNLLIVEVEDTYDLRIEGISFHILQNQEILESHHLLINSNVMSKKLIPDEKEDWENLAVIYKIFITPGLKTPHREILPIFSKKITKSVPMNKSANSRSFLIYSENNSNENLAAKSKVQNSGQQSGDCRCF